MKKSRRQLEEERLAEEGQRAARKERRRRACEALDRDELADEVAAGAKGAAAVAVALRVRDGYFEEERQGMEEVDLQPSASLPAAPLYSVQFLRRFACVAALGVALTCGAASTWRRNNPLPRFQLGSSTLVTIRSLHASGSGKASPYLQLSARDGLLRASAASPHEVGSVFRVLVLSSATVRALRLAAASRQRFSEEHEHKGRTRSGCRCSGFSNEHGYGRFCHPWENSFQPPWCYVDGACAAAEVAGSFGRRHEECAPWQPGQESTGLDSDSDRSQAGGRGPEAWAGGQGSAGAAAGAVGESYPGETALAETAPRPLGGSGWRPRAACACSGYSNAHGFGAACAAWEAPHSQAPPPTWP